MKAIARHVVVVLLGVMFFPAVSLAKPGPAPAADVAPSPFGPRPQQHTAPASPAAPAASGSAADLAAREQQSKELQSFRGGGVYVYLGSGALAVLVVVLLILLL
jgi:hypothetical protein